MLEHTVQRHSVCGNSLRGHIELGISGKKGQSPDYMWIGPTESREMHHLEWNPQGFRIWEHPKQSWSCSMLDEVARKNIIRTAKNSGGGPWCPMLCSPVGVKIA